MKSRKIDNHPVVIHSGHLRMLGSPLNSIGITYFSHVRQYNDGRFAGLSTSPEYAAHYLENEYYNVDLHTVSDKHGDMVIWDHLERVGLTRKMHEEAAAFGVKHTFSLIEKKPTYIEVFHFAADVNDNYINQVYLAKLHYLKQFILNYKEKLNQDAGFQSIFEKPTLQLDSQTAGYQIKDENCLLNYINDPTNHFADSKNKIILPQECNKPITLLHYQTQHQITLTLQQSKCLHGTLQAKTTKEIGKNINLSYRTVEHYLERVRSYLGCKSNKELLARYANQLVHCL